MSDSFYIHVKILAGQKKEVFTCIDESHFEIRLKEKAKQNMANTRMLELFHEHFASAKRIRIINGHHSPSKLLSVEM